MPYITPLTKELKKMILGANGWIANPLKDPHEIEDAIEEIPCDDYRDLTPEEQKGLDLVYAEFKRLFNNKTKGEK